MLLLMQEASLSDSSCLAADRSGGRSGRVQAAVKRLTQHSSGIHCDLLVSLLRPICKRVRTPAKYRWLIVKSQRLLMLIPPHDIDPYDVQVGSC
jgi:hypothetical protein